MKQLKFLIVAAFVIFATECVMAVQLPSTSYTPVPSASNENEFAYQGGSLYRGSYSVLKSAVYTDCEPGDVLGEAANGKTCEACCAEAVEDEDLKTECVSYCWGDDNDPLSPLDPSTWFIIMFSACVLLVGCLKAWYRKQA